MAKKKSKGKSGKKYCTYTIGGNEPILPNHINYTTFIKSNYERRERLAVKYKFVGIWSMESYLKMKSKVKSK